MTNKIIKNAEFVDGDETALCSRCPGQKTHYIIYKGE